MPYVKRHAWAARSTRSARASLHRHARPHTLRTHARQECHVLATVAWRLAAGPLPLRRPGSKRREPDVRTALVHEYEPLRLSSATRSHQTARASSSRSEAAIIFACRSTRACGSRGSSALEPSSGLIPGLFLGAADETGSAALFSHRLRVTDEPPKAPVASRLGPVVDGGQRLLPQVLRVRLHASQHRTGSSTLYR